MYMQIKIYTNISCKQRRKAKKYNQKPEHGDMVVDD